LKVKDLWIEELELIEWNKELLLMNKTKKSYFKKKEEIIKQELEIKKTKELYNEQLKKYQIYNSDKNNILEELKDTF